MGGNKCKIVWCCWFKVVPSTEKPLSCNTALFHVEVHDIFRKNANVNNGDLFNTRHEL